MTPREVIALCREKEVKAVDLRFADLFGTWHHFTIPVGKLEEGLFEDGFGFDGSSIRAWRSVNEADMLAMPQADTAFVDTFSAVPTLALICDVHDPITGESYTRDPRYVARKAENHLKSTGVAETAYFGPEAEFFVFDEARFNQNAHEGYYHLDSGEAEWNRGHAGGAGRGHQLRHKEGYSPCPPSDSLVDLRNEMMQAMIDCGLDVQSHNHEAASAGQCVIDLDHQPLVHMGDWMMIYKHVVRNVARRHGKTATFMPKPLYGDNGSGMHVHFSFWRDQHPLFAGGSYAGLSETGLHALGGILRHAPALLALTNPTTNSYKRLVPGYEAPVHLVYSQRNRSAACRIPMYNTGPRAKRIEFRCPDPSCNPYLAFAAITMAAIDGIQNKINPGQPVDRDLYSLTAAESAHIAKTPGSLHESLAALEKDCDFLLRDDVFTPDVIETWISYKRKHDVDALRLRPHPYEFCLYYDV